MRCQLIVKHHENCWKFRGRLQGHQYILVYTALCTILIKSLQYETFLNVPLRQQKAFESQTLNPKPETLPCWPWGFQRPCTLNPTPYTLKLETKRALNPISPTCISKPYKIVGYDPLILRHNPSNSTLHFRAGRASPVQSKPEILRP